MSKLITEVGFTPFMDDPIYDEPQYEPKNYRDGGEGMIKWTEENVCLPIYPEGEVTAQWYPVSELPKEKNPLTGKSYHDIWAYQKRILRQALKMEYGRLIYNLIIFCWMRGEGKSLLACIVQLWKFFNWTRQAIMLGANSKDQVKFVHYDIMRDIIQHSPNLYSQVGSRNIQEKEIRLKDEMTGGVVSLIRSISSFSGIVSNITGFTFSEMFDMKNPRFYVQLYGSIRDVPNALGVIDSTVSEKTHVLYKLYTNFMEKKTKLTYFSYRSSRLGVPEDYWNPNMDEAQLNDYRENFPFGEFERYFQNLWSAGALRVFTQEQIDEMGYIGIDGVLMNHDNVKEAIHTRNKYTNQKQDLEEKGIHDSGAELDSKINDVDDRLWPVDYAYHKFGNYSIPELTPVNVLERLGSMLDTDWAILSGADLGDPISVRSRARSIFSVIAKGLIGSKKHAFGGEGPAPKYVYLLLYMCDISDHSLPSLKEALDMCNEEYEGIDTFCMERYGIGDMIDWCEDRNITIEPIFPNYERQKVAFKELYIAIDSGKFKAPSIRIHGSKKEDILREELEIFDHDSEKKWFGSPEKSEKYGIQDDCVYSVAWTMYGGRLLTPIDFRPRAGNLNFGTFIPEKSLLGAY